jgi:hypothetical protein
MDQKRIFISAKKVTKLLSPVGGVKRAAETGGRLDKKRQHKEKVRHPI